MTTGDDIARQAADFRLMVAGVVTAPDLLPADARSLVLLAPDEPAFWPFVSAAPEFDDGLADPLDRWSTRCVTELAASLGGRAILPHLGPPYAPFYSWALASGRAWASPVTLLAHDTAGLFISYRGALALPYAVDQQPGVNPCDGCAKPCLAACPAAALAGEGYDVAACHGYLDQEAGAGCLTGGCLVRRACPVGQNRRLPAQSAYHMRLFHK